jgi:outer membrane protein assembly factor BamB/tetratricopeptide (TPR) repeat protein
MLSPRRACLLFLAALFVCWAAASRAAEPKEGPPLRPITDPALEKRLDAAAAAVRDGKWAEAADALQWLLDLEPEGFVAVTRERPDGSKRREVLGVRAEAERLLAGLPAGGREEYEKRFGPVAAALLRVGRKHRDPVVLAEAGRRFANLPDGQEALAQLGRYEFEAGDFARSAAAYLDLLKHLPAEKWDAETLSGAARAFEAVDDGVNGLRVGAELGKRDKDGFSTARAERVLQDWDVPGKQYARRLSGDPDWPLFRHDAARSGRGPADVPLLDARWTQATVTGAGVRQLLGTAARAEEAHGRPVLPAAFPLVVGGKVVFRTHGGVRAVDLETGKVGWDGESKKSLESPAGEGQKGRWLDEWAAGHLKNGRPDRLLENSVIGTLAADRDTVYAVDDAAVPPPAGYDAESEPRRPAAEAAAANRLLALELKSGKVRWEDAPPAGTLLLGPPLPLDGRLYLLADVRRELRLLCLRAADGDLLWSLPLGRTTEDAADYPERRVHAAVLAQGEGVLVVPTHCGALVGVDLLTHSVLWSHAYRDRAADEGPAAWRAPAPVIAAGRVVCTPPDAVAVLCLGLHDGQLRWKADQTRDDLYLAAVVGDRVLVVGKGECRGLKLADGSEAWTVKTGVPSGQGVAGGGKYYLPLRSGAESHGPEVCVLDVAKGVVVARARSRGAVVPGNLVFHEDAVVSQTLFEVAAFPLRARKLQEIGRLLAEVSPNDPTALTERAVLRYDAGNLEAAVEDLRAALANQPPAAVRARARQKLYEVLTEYLQRDFGKGEKYLDEYQALTRVEVGPDATATEKAAARAEEGRRRAGFLLLRAAGRERKGTLVDALKDYLELLTLPGDDLLPVPGDPGLTATADSLAGARIRPLLQKASPEQKKLLDEEIDKRWQEIKAGGDAEKIKRFEKLFGPRSALGREAGWLLAERLRKDKKYLEAELALLALARQTEDAKDAARAVAALAELAVEKEHLGDAVSWYRVLRRDFAKVEVGAGKKTGADLFADAASDKRLLPYFDPARGSDSTRTRTREEPGAFAAPAGRLTFTASGEVPPSVGRHRLAVEVPKDRLVLLDLGDPAQKWEEGPPSPLTRELLRDVAALSPEEGLRFEAVGRLVLLPLPERLLAVDPLQHRILWAKPLAADGAGDGPVFVRPRQGPTELAHADGWVQRLGQLPLAGPDVVCVPTAAGLAAVDTLTGRTRWLRTDVPARYDLFGDDGHVFLVEVTSDGKPVATRALDADAGSPIEVPEFTDLYAQRRSIVGRHLLVQETGAGARVTLRLVDALTAKDAWKESGNNLVLVRSEPAGLVGVASLSRSDRPGGEVATVTVVNPATGQAVFRAEIDPKHFDNAVGVTVVQDNNLVYLLVNRLRGSGSGPEPALPSAFDTPAGVRWVPVNGVVYGCDRTTGALKWRVEAEESGVVLDHLDELPFLLVTGRHWPGRYPRGGLVEQTAVRVIDKRTGKLKYSNAELFNGRTTLFHTLRLDEQTRTLELIAENGKLALTWGDR